MWAQRVAHNDSLTLQGTDTPVSPLFLFCLCSSEELSKLLGHTAPTERTESKGHAANHRVGRGFRGWGLRGADHSGWLYRGRQRTSLGAEYRADKRLWTGPYIRQEPQRISSEKSRSI